jgi:Ca2+-binding RTX toxin-like protein
MIITRKLVISLAVAILFPLGASAHCGGKHTGDHPHCSDGGGSPNPGEITGTEGSDDLCPFATEFDDLVKGLGGDDTLCGFAGDDNLQGDAGNDMLIGGLGNDTLGAGEGDDTVYAGAGDDRILADVGNDTIHGDASDPVKDPGAGGAGFDWISFNSTGQQIIVDFTTSPGTITNILTGDIDTVTGVEKVTGPLEDDQFYGGPGDEFFGGGRGDDYFHGGAGNDFIGADRGNDTIRGGQGSDQLRGAEHEDVFEFYREDYVSGEVDVVEDFSTRKDSLVIDGMFVMGITFPQPGGGGPKADTEVTLRDCGTGDSVGKIVFWDISLDESFFPNGC